MAAVHDHRQVHACLHPVQRRPQPVVAQRIVPVEVGRTQDLVAAIGFILVVIGHVRPVARVMDQRDVTLLRIANQRLDARLHRLLGRREVGDDGDVAPLEAVKLGQGCAEVLDVVDTASEVGAGDLIPVDADEKRTLCHCNLPKRT